MSFFISEKDRLQDEKLPIYARITIMGKRIELAMKQKIRPEDWNKAKGMAKPKKEEFKVLNNFPDTRFKQLRPSIR